MSIFDTYNIDVHLLRNKLEKIAKYSIVYLFLMLANIYWQCAFILCIYIYGYVQ
jgi:hypothetical protein